MNYEITSKTEYPENGKTQLVKYDVELELNGKTYQKGFNLDPGQDIHGHIERWIHDLR